MEKYRSFSTAMSIGREPNKAAPGNGAITLLSDAGRSWRAVPERYRWAAE